jgi:zinc D-Ala-D-Ala dipeptidase
MPLMDSVVLMGDPAVARVPVEECDEALVDAGGVFVLSDLKKQDEPHRSRLRAGVMERLQAAQTHLPDGFRLCLVEGLRTWELQASYFNSYRDQLIGSEPDLSQQESYLKATRYVSAPEIAPHVSGAAIDLTLCDPDGNELDLGSPINASPEASDGVCYFDALVNTVARRHRSILRDSLVEVGMINYPTEWWHWSYGDRYWALMTGRAAALYGPITTP